METYITIGEIIKHYRKEAGLSQQELAENICDRKYIGMIERSECIPTLDMVNQLSGRLGINLYDTYALMLHHRDIDTHERIELLNECFGSIEKIQKLPELLNEFSALPGFQSGEPKQFIKYGESIYASNIEDDYPKAINAALEGLLIHYQTLEQLLDSRNNFSNAEINLLITLAVNYCRINEYEKGKEFFQLLYQHLSRIVSKKRYAVNRNHHYEQNALALVVYNQFLFFRTEFEDAYRIINETLEQKKGLKNSYLLPNLLLCKASLEYEMKQYDLARKTYHIADCFGTYFYSEQHFESVKQTVLKDNYAFFIQN